MQITTPSRTHKLLELAAAIAVSLLIVILPNSVALTGLLTSTLDTVSSDNVDTSDFSFSSFDAAYTLGRDDEGRSQLSTVETLVAQFPPEDQNTGIVRRIPNFYKGHSTHVRVTSVTDAAGETLEHTVDPGGDYTSIRITDGSYRHGETTFVVTYDQTDVTASYTDENDELYWDVNGVDWPQSFSVVRASITLDPSLNDALTDDLSCYTGKRGEEGSACTITAFRNGSESTVIFADTESSEGYSSLSAYENLTVAVGFEPGTFAPAPLDISARIASAWYWLGGMWTLGPVISALGFLALALLWRWNERRLSRPASTVIAQYAPPPNLTVARAAYLLNTRKTKRSAFAADTVDHVVRKNLILDRTGSSYTVRMTDNGTSKVTDTLSTRGAYWVVLTKDRRSRQLGAVEVTKSNQALRLAFGELRARLQASVMNNFTSIPRWKSARGVLVVGAVAAAGIALATYGPRSGGNASANLVLLWGLIAFAAPVFSLIALFNLNLPTADTLKIQRHLEGLRVYIRLAEQDRMRVLQGPGTAEVVALGETDVIRLNEKLLGYAVLFGLEKKWAAQIGVSSTTGSTSAVSDLVAGAGLGSFVSAVSSTTPQTPPSSGGGGDGSGGGGFSGSSGGSDGGGSSGDGGGGGGGDGI